MVTRKTTKNYKVELDFDVFQESFEFYTGYDFAFKDVSRNYNLPKAGGIEYYDWEIDYMLGNKSKKEIIEEEDVDENDFVRLDELKNEYNIVGLSFGDHSNVYIWYWNDGILFAGKDDSMETIDLLVKKLDSRFNWWIYRIAIYEPKEYVNKENCEDSVIYWDYVDGCTGFLSQDEALESIPDTFGEIRKETESERFDEFERC